MTRLLSLASAYNDSIDKPCLISGSGVKALHAEMDRLRTEGHTVSYKTGIISITLDGKEESIAALLPELKKYDEAVKTV